MHHQNERAGVDAGNRKHLMPEWFRGPRRWCQARAPFLALGLLLPWSGLTAQAVEEASSAAHTAEWQIRFAVETLPEQFREGASVYLREGEGGLDLTPVREAEGDFVCLLTLEPEEETANAACYHQSLEPFMARGRELRRDGVDGPEMVDARNREVDEGLLPMPEEPASLYQRTAGPGQWDPATGDVHEAGSLFVIYVPFATAESTGLSTQPARGAPWLMDPGTPRAHIMFQPDMQPGGG